MAFDFRDLDQKLFGWAWSLAKSFSKPQAGVSPFVVALDPLLLRLSLLASAVAETRVRVEPTDDEGGLSGATIRLPRTIAALDSIEENAALYVMRAVLEAQAMRSKLSRPEGLSDEESRLLATLLLRPLRRQLQRDLHGAGKSYDSLAKALLAKRHLERAASSAEQAVELCARWALFDGGDVDVHGVAFSWLAEELHELDLLEPLPFLYRAIPLAKRILLLAPKAKAPLFPRVILAGQLLPLGGMSGIELLATAETQALPQGSERKARAKDYLRRVHLPEERDGENPLEHSFEKVHTAETYQGGHKTLDGEDELAEQADALDELDVREVIRTREKARSVYSMDGLTSFDPQFDDEPLTLEGEQECFYDEWDGRKMRPKYCRLVVEVPKDSRDDLAKIRDRELTADKKRIRRLFESLEDRRRARSRQPTGNEVDIDAVVERYGFVHAGQEGPDRLYIDRLRIEPDLATLILIDLSSSSDAWIEGRRVLDTARDAVTMLAEVLTELDAQFSVGGFHSHTHRDCRYVVLKAFDERWHDVRGRFFAVQPTGYTRIGPALRHATAILKATLSRRKALCIVTDGKPTDYDAYEGRYGVTDVKKACDEAVMSGIEPFALAITERKAPHLTEMFGPGGYEILSHPSQLADRLAVAQARWRM